MVQRKEIHIPISVSFIHKIFHLVYIYSYAKKFQHFDKFPHKKYSIHRFPRNEYIREKKSDHFAVTSRNSRKFFAAVDGWIVYECVRKCEMQKFDCKATNSLESFRSLVCVYIAKKYFFCRIFLYNGNFLNNR